MRKPSLAVERAMLAALEYAARYPKRWYDIGNEATYCRAIELLVKRGVVEVNHADQYRLKES